MYNPYIENPAVARAMADNERRQAESDAAEAQREADKEEAACRRKYYGEEIIKAWVTCDDLGQEDYEKSDSRTLTILCITIRFTT